MKGRAVQAIAEESDHDLQDHAVATAGPTAETVAGAIQRIDQLTKQINWKQIASDTVEAVKNNPQVIVIPAAIAVSAMTGGVLMGPALEVVGFSPIGPVPGKAHT
jgi:hypothetical protein